MTPSPSDRRIADARIADIQQHLARLGNKSTDLLMQKSIDDDEKHLEAHKRLRQSLNENHTEVTTALTNLTKRAGAIESQIAELKAVGADASKLKFPLQLVIGIVAVWSALYASTYGLKSDVRDILTHQDMQRAVELERTKIQDERASQLTKAVEAMRGRQELQQIEIQNLKEIVLTLKTEKRQ